MHPADLQRLIRDATKNGSPDVPKAMKLLDRAHAKAAKQKEDYAKFLQWKIQMQRKERERRDVEEADFRDAVEDRLKTILTQHRQQRRDDHKKWTQYAKSAPPRRRHFVPHGPIVQLREEEEARLKAKVEAREEALATSAATQKSSRRSRLHSKLHRSSNGEGAGPAVGGDGGGGSETVASAIQRLRERIGADELAALQFPTSAAQRLDTMTMSNPTARAGKWHLQEVERRRRSHAAAQRRLEEKQDLYNKAYTRRLYSMNKLLEDPPADYLIGGDVLRYVASDILKQPRAITDESAPDQPAASRLFLTALGEDGTTQEPHVPSDLLGPEYGVVHQPRRPRRRTFDPLDLHLSTIVKLPPIGTTSGQDASPSAPSMRNRDEENAIVEWYTEHCMPYSRVVNRTERRGASYHWERAMRYKLPTMPGDLSLLLPPGST